MAANIVHLEPGAAASGISTMATNLNDFLTTVKNMNNEVAQIAAETISAPFSTLFINTTNGLNEIGSAVSTSCNSFCDALRTVYNNWITVHATQAAQVSYTDATFTSAPIPAMNASMVNVRPGAVEDLLNQFRSNNTQLQSQFSAIDRVMQSSNQYWQGQSHDFTLSTWSQVARLMPQVEQNVQTFITNITNNHDALVTMDAQNYVKQG